MEGGNEIKNQASHGCKPVGVSVSERTSGITLFTKVERSLSRASTWMSPARGSLCRISPKANKNVEKRGRQRDEAENLLWM